MSSSVLRFLESVMAQAFKEKGEPALTHEEFKRAINSTAVDPMDLIKLIKNANGTLLFPIIKKLTIWILERRENRGIKN